MPYAPMNVLLEKPLPPKSTLLLRYPDGKNEGHFFGGMNHTLSVDGTFFRSPRDFTLLPQHDNVIFTWNGNFLLPARTLLNIQAEIPGGDFYFDNKTGVTVSNMVHSPLFMVNLASPLPSNDRYWVEPAPVEDARPLTLAYTQVPTARNVVIFSDSDNSQATFTIEGEDMYRRAMIEKITLDASKKAAGKKAFLQIHRIHSSAPCTGQVWVGTGEKLGLPVFLPSPGYLLQEIINGVATTGSTVIGGETAPPSATAGDRRGTYTPPAGTLDGKKSIHLLLSLLAPGNIGIPDYAG